MTPEQLKLLFRELAEFGESLERIAEALEKIEYDIVHGDVSRDEY